MQRYNKAVAAVLGSLLLAGCANDLLDDIEDGAYDAVAEALSEYCETSAAGGLFAQRTRIEVRREARQRGWRGPPSPDPVPDGLDEQTAQGQGPVLMLWCGNETNGQGDPYLVPEAVWRAMIRDWRD